MEKYVLVCVLLKQQRHEHCSKPLRYLLAFVFSMMVEVMLWWLSLQTPLRFQNIYFRFPVFIILSILQRISEARPIFSAELLQALAIIGTH